MCLQPVPDQQNCKCPTLGEHRLEAKWRLNKYGCDYGLKRPRKSKLCAPKTIMKTLHEISMKKVGLAWLMKQTSKGGHRAEVRKHCKHYSNTEAQEHAAKQPRYSRAGRGCLVDRRLRWRKAAKPVRSTFVPGFMQPAHQPLVERCSQARVQRTGQARAQRISLWHSAAPRPGRSSASAYGKALLPGQRAAHQPMVKRCSQARAQRISIR